MKKVAERFVPKEIYSRVDKRGFSAPLNKWFGWDKLGKGQYQRETYKKIVYNDWKKTFINNTIEFLEYIMTSHEVLFSV